MTAAHDELHAVIYKYFGPPSQINAYKTPTQQDHELTDAILAAGYRKPRVITTAEELDQLPLGSVVVDLSGTARTKRRANGYMPGGWTAGGLLPITASELADGHPMTVVWEPQP